MAKKEKVRLTVALAVYNEARNLDACLSSVLGWADEIIIVDGGSTDETVAIAKQYGAKVIETDNPAMFHINKQKALDASGGDWILQLDADEVVSSELREEIRQVMYSPHAANGYAIPRKNYFLGHWLSKGGQYPDYVIRLFRKGAGIFPLKSVHEQIAVTGAVKHLTHPLLHFTSRTLSDYWRKADAYTSLTAETLRKDGVGKNVWMFCVYVLWKPFRTFVLLSLRHKGILDGIWGVLFAWFSGLHHAIAYWKYLSARDPSTEATQL